MKLRRRSYSRIMTIATFVGALATTALSGPGCTDSSGGLGTGGTSAIGAAGAAGNSAGATAGAGGAGGAADAGGVGGTADAGGAGGGSAGGAAGALGSAAAACAATAAPTSGIDPTTRLDALTLAQKATLCDWVASRYCGYDQHVPCGGGTTLDSFPTQAECIANMTATLCDATVGDSEACEKDATCADSFPDSCLPASMCQ